jgi:hypothetical protein
MYALLLCAAALAPGQQGTELAKPPAETPAAPVPIPQAPALERPSAANAPAAALPDRWLLMRELQGTPAGGLLDDNRVAVYGWAELGATFGSAPGNNLPLGFNYRDNSFSLQQNWVRVERTVVTSGTTEPTWGFRSDWILPGTDYRYTLPHGLLDYQLTQKGGQPNTYGFDPVQFYAEAYFPTVGQGLDLKVGRFYAQYGVESVEAPGNALFSHAYTFLDNPYTQTGVVASLQMTKEWSAAAGFVLGDDVFFDGGDPTFIGNVKWARADGRDSVVLSTIVSSGRYNPARQLNNVNVLDLVLTHKINARLSYTFESLGGCEGNYPGIGTAYWVGVVNYLTYDWTKHLSSTARLEFWDDPRGVRTGGNPGLYSTLTAGLNFHPGKEVVFRPEVRYDLNDESRAFQGQYGLFTAAADLILRW